MVVTPQKSKLALDIWVKATWEDFVALADDRAYTRTNRFYYDRDAMRIEMAALGPIHARENAIVSKVVSLFATLKNIRIFEYLNCSFRKEPERECQPDLAFYIGEGLRLPASNNSPVNLKEHDPPTLIIEIASTTLNDDLGHKRLLYERLGVREYWVVDVEATEVYAFEIADGRSGRIQASQVLAGLRIATVEEALLRSQSEDDGAIARWLLQTFNA
ncbi:Uma2 family endonuclease [Pseudanabaena sp. PCC 6802]|uniref:Uma2 family endonuclease n=1 Tax=Pseudanabaena sp. PCC 6802 TaxID=118173 RepID=UPI00034790CC|nr:Uma2 family endonuclease [Pseudanabaena sp. PCC 6802]